MSVHLLAQVMKLDVDAELKVRLFKMADNGNIDGIRKLGFSVEDENDSLPKNNQHTKSNISNSLRWKIWEYDNFTCKICGSRYDLTVDHILAESNGGETTIDNLQTLCRSCNSRKGAK